MPRTERRPRLAPVSRPPVTERRSDPSLAAASRPPRRRSPLRRHSALWALLAAGAALRLLALVAVYPGIWFSDTNSYVTAAATGTLSFVRVVGYSLVVSPFWQLGSAGALIVTQHVLGLGIVALVYALLVRRGVSRGLAAAAVVPAALDAYLIDIEHMIMSETVFHAAVVGGIALLVWRPRPGAVALAGAGLLLGYAAVVRSVAMPFAVVFVAYLLVRRVGWRRLVAFAGAWTVVVVGYATLFDVQHGEFGFTRYGGRFLYGQVAPFANCAQLPRLPAKERPLCPDAHQRLTRISYLWGARSPIHRLPVAADGRIKDFSLRAIRAQPLEYAKVVVGNFIHYFEPGHHTGRDDYSETAWQFPIDPRHWTYPGYRGPIRPGRAHRRHGIDPNRYLRAMVSRPHTDAAASEVLHVYQIFAYSSGQVLAPCLLVVVIVLALRRGDRRLRLDAALLAAVALTALLVASALSAFDYRYGLGATILLPAAAALAASALMRPTAAQP
jgi:hypothetical protein